MRILVLGVGNPIFGDDGLGLQIVRDIKERISVEKLSVEVDVEETHSDWLTIAEKIIGYDKVILIDTLIVEDKNLIGKIFKIDLKMPSEEDDQPYITHDLSFSSALKIIKSLSPEEIPEKIIMFLVGIREPKRFSEKLSPEVKGIAPRLLKYILDEFSNSSIKN
jgi:hydrogenase maturation protease